MDDNNKRKIDDDSIPEKPFSRSKITIIRRPSNSPIF